MAEPFLSEIRIMSFTYAPKGWTLCNGQLLPINQNQALFSLLGTTYGGDGRVNFALPDLRGRVPISMGDGFTLGERGGEQAHTVSLSELPEHLHFPAAKNIQGDTGNPSASVALAIAVAKQADGSTVPVNMYSINAPTDVALAPDLVGLTGGSQAHLNMQPFLVLNFSIALQGIFPSQT